MWQWYKMKPHNTQKAQNLLPYNKKTRNQRVAKLSVKRRPTIQQLDQTATCPFLIGNSWRNLWELWCFFAVKMISRLSSTANGILLLTSCVTSRQLKALHRWWVCNKLYHVEIIYEQNASKNVKLCQQMAKLCQK